MSYPDSVESLPSEIGGSEGGVGGASIRHYWHVILERRWMVIMTFFCVMIACGLYLYKAERVYRASVRLQIDRESSSTLNLGNAVFSIGSADAAYLQTQYKNLLSRSLVAKVVKKLKLDEDPRYAKEMDVLEAVIDDLAVKPIRLTRLVDVTADHTDAKKAAAVANTLTETFREENGILRQQRMLENLFFLQDQSDKLEREVSSAEKALQTYREQTRYASLDREQNFIAQALSQVQATYAQAKSAAAASQTAVDELDKHLADGNPLETFPSIATHSQINFL